MDRSNLSRAEDLFHRAMDVPQQARDAWLDRQCRGEEALKCEVRLLIDASTRHSVLDRPAFVSLDPVADGADPVAGKRVGPYRLSGILGYGAMGVVYEANAPSRPESVALKLVRGGFLAGGTRLKMFRRESESLKRLDHPSIAKFLDSGATEEGVPYYAMEKVEGIDLWTYRERYRPDPPTILRLVVAVAEAVDYAHRRGIVHRDLKPSNILLTLDEDNGQAASVKLLDFGLAQLTDHDVDLTTTISESGKILGSLPYMSPEQARGDLRMVGVRSDIYSLGVILFELLTGARPYEIGTTALHESVRTICETEPKRLSSFERSLRGPLETIVATAMAKEAHRRYQSVESLREDLTRYLEQRPILARPPSALYPLRRWVRAHKVIAVLTVLLLAITTGSAVLFAGLYWRAQEAEQRTREEAGSLRETLVYIQEILGVVHPMLARGRHVEVGDVLRFATLNLDRLHGQPHVESTVRSVLAHAYLVLGNLDDAEVQILSALKDVDDGSMPEVTKSTLFRLRGTLRYHQARFEEARRDLDRASGILAELESPPLVELMRVQGTLARIASIQGDYQEAQRLFANASGVTLSDVSMTEASEQVALLFDHANLCALLGQHEEVDRLSSRAVEIVRDFSGKRSLDGDGIQRAILLTDQEADWDHAESFYRRILESYRRTLGEHHPATAAVLDNLGHILVRQGDFDDAEAVLKEALDSRRAMFDEGHPSLSTSLVSLANLERARRSPDRAEAYYLEALSIRERVFGGRHIETARIWRGLADIHLDRLNLLEAGRCYRNALEIFQEGLGERHMEAGHSLLGLARVQDTSGDIDGALPRYREVLSIFRDFAKDGDPVLSTFLVGFGERLLELGYREEARPLLEEAIDHLDVAQRADEETLDRAWNLMARCDTCP